MAEIEFGAMRSEPGSEPAVFDPMAEMPNFWDLTDRELAKSCRLMAEGQAMGTSGLTSAEAMRLSLVWNDAFNSPTRSGEEREKRAALTAQADDSDFGAAVHSPGYSRTLIPRAFILR